MAEKLLRTKLFIPPLRPNVVRRRRLSSQLNQGLHQGHKLTLISAPAGFGKTTLVSEWAADFEADGDGAGPKITWLSLDEKDSDLARFLAHLIGSLNEVDGLQTAVGQGALGMLQSPQTPSADNVLTSLINDTVALPDQTVVVLDDYHCLDSAPVDGALAFLLEHMPPQMHLVMTTRVDPAFPLSRLRARGQLTELRAADLRFNSLEVCQFLNEAMGLDLTAEDIATLEYRTEGWIAGLQLVALSIRGRSDTAGAIKSFSGSHRFVLDYLLEEVLEQQSKRIQAFLLQTAVLSKLSGSLCDALTNRHDGQGTLEDLERDNLFIIPLDRERRWFRYHHLFADLLRQRLGQTHPEELPTLHLKASIWYEQNGDNDEAIEHALSAADYARAADLISDYVDDFWQFGEDSKLRRWLDGLPHEVLCSQPQLGIVQAWNLYTGGQPEEADQLLGQVEQALGPNPSEGRGHAPSVNQDAVDRGLWGRAAAVRAHLISYEDDVEGSIRHANEALNNLPESDAIWRWSALDSLGSTYSGINEPAAYQARSEALEASLAAGNVYMTMLASLRLVVTLRDLGRLQQAREICARQLKRAEENGLAQTALTGWLYALWGEILAENNQLNRALELAEKGVSLAARGKDAILLGSTQLCLLRVLFSRGELEIAEEIIEEASYFSTNLELSPWITYQMKAWQARIQLVKGNLESASFWAAQLEDTVGRDLTPLHDFEYAIIARVLIAQGRLDEAAVLLQRLLAAAEAGERTSKMIEIMTLQALLQQAYGDSEQALIRLEQALILAEPGAFIRLFVDEGPPLAQLLQLSLSRDIMPDYTQRLLSAFDASAQNSTSQSETVLSALLDPLSEREIEILNLIAAGRTNPQIASILFLALNTVKVHTRNIYSKLGVHSRTQAVAKARELDLL